MKTILILLSFITFISLNTQIANAADDYSTKKCVAALGGHVREVSDRLKTEVQRLESELKRELSETEQAAANVTDINTQITDLKQRMTWLERNLWRWLAKLLGGDAKKIDELKERRKRKTHLEKLLRRDQREDQDADNAIVAKIDSYLREHDRKFARLRAVEADLNEIVCQGDVCLREIDGALNQTGDAETAELLDMATDSIGISLLSHMSTSAANDSASAAKKAVEAYVEVVQQLKGQLEAVSTEIGSVDDTVDLVVDIVFDFGFDFLSVVNLFALGDLKEDLGKMRKQIAEIRNGLKDEHDKVKSELDALVCEVRGICNGTSGQHIRP